MKTLHKTGATLDAPAVRAINAAADALMQAVGYIGRDHNICIDLEDAASRLRHLLDDASGAHCAHFDSQVDTDFPDRPGEVERRHAGEWCYILQLVNCGKGKCKLCRGTAYRHGPYWYGYKRSNGKMISKYIGKEVEPIDTADGFDTIDDETATDPK